MLELSGSLELSGGNTNSQLRIALLLRPLLQAVLLACLALLWEDAAIADAAAGSAEAATAGAAAEAASAAAVAAMQVGSSS